jgi:hypothetical protein
MFTDPMACATHGRRRLRTSGRPFHRGEPCATWVSEEAGGYDSSGARSNAGSSASSPAFPISISDGHGRPFVAAAGQGAVTADAAAPEPTTGFDVHVHGGVTAGRITASDRVVGRREWWFTVDEITDSGTAVSSDLRVVLSPGGVRRRGYSAVG